MDLLVLVKGKSGDREEGIETGYPVSAVVYTVREFERAVLAGVPIAFHVYRAHIVLEDRGCFSKLTSTVEPRVTENTIVWERRSTLAELSLAIEKLALGLTKTTLAHLHHALRHAARTLTPVGAPFTAFPIYDREVAAQLSQEGRSLLGRLREARERPSIAYGEAVELLEETMRVTEAILDVEMPDPLPALRKCVGRTVVLSEEQGRVVLYCDYSPLR